jgi:predicted amidohydrolase YtcJ
MSRARPTMVLCGEVVVAAASGGIETAEAVGIAGDRVVRVGSRREVIEAAARGARIEELGRAAIIPGLCDFHVHLVGLARARASVRLDDARGGVELVGLIRQAARRLAPDAWLTGRGWSEAQLASVTPAMLEDAIGSRAAFLTSHDGHSAWASAAARRVAHLDERTADPPGGRVDRDVSGAPTGILRETALDLVAGHVPRLQGSALRAPLDATLRELAGFGITGGSEAGDYTDANGIGVDAALGDSYSSLTDLGDLVDGRLRLSLGIPVDAIPAAAGRGLRTGAALPGRQTLRFGWAKEYADGALGSGTAALFAPRTCGDGGTGILRVTPDELDRLAALARPAGIGLAIHAIGDRAAASVLDALERAAPRSPGTPDDRMEHVQLLRAQDRPRLAQLGVTASVQPIHAAADRDLVDDCWRGREALAYAWRSLAAAGARLAAGSDAPVESPDPWLAFFAAIHRRHPDDVRGDWRAGESLDAASALAAYTAGPAGALGAADEGHLRPGARADLAVLTVDRGTLLSGGPEVAGIRSILTLVNGTEVPGAARSL